VVPHEPLLVLDAAHNAASAQLLRTAIAELFSQRPLALIFGASADKDIAGMFDALLPISDYLIAAQAVHPRALATEEIERIARQTGFAGPVVQIAAADEALQRASELVGPDGIICATGSMFLVGEMRTFCGLPPGHVILAVPSSVAAVRSPCNDCE
jgi:dihydrofolate synthase/folylpolyglutamate synthase